MRPTEPGYYQLRDGELMIVHVFQSRGELLVEYFGTAGTDPVDLYSDTQWGGKVSVLNLNAILEELASVARGFDYRRG